MTNVSPSPNAETGVHFKVHASDDIDAKSEETKENIAMPVIPSEPNTLTLPHSFDFRDTDILGIHLDEGGKSDESRYFGRAGIILKPNLTDSCLTEQTTTDAVDSFVKTRSVGDSAKRINESECSNNVSQASRMEQRSDVDER